jgi:hypothetical protein
LLRLDRLERGIKFVLNFQHEAWGFWGLKRPDTDP